MGGQGSGKYVRSFTGIVKDIEASLKPLQDAIIEEVTDTLRDEIKQVKQDAAQGIEEAIAIQRNNEDGTQNQLVGLAHSPQAVIKSAPVIVTNTDTARKYKGRRLQSLSAARLDAIERDDFELNADILIGRSGWDGGQTHNVSGLPVSVKSIRIRSRGPSASAQRWTLWRAIEFGGTPGNVAMVRAKPVLSITPGATGATVSTGQDIVFMARRPGWWLKHEVPGYTEVLMGGEVYWGGSAPVRRAVEASKSRVQPEVEQAIRRALDRVFKR